MIYNHFFAKISLLLICAGLFFSACEKGPQLFSSSEDIKFDETTTDTMTIQISSNVSWTATVDADCKWLKVEPQYGKGNATISLIVEENDEFIERIAFVAISGDGVKTDTIKVVQAPSVDVAEKIIDENFRRYCLDLFDASQDGRISVKEAKSAENKIEENGNTVYRYKMLPRGMGITTLAGIEYFTKIRELNCENNQLKDIDVSKNKEIRTLNCSYNQIDAIDVGDLTKLTTLKIYNNNLKNIDVSKNDALFELWISNNAISEINVGNNKNLDLLQCGFNQLTKLDVSKNIKLTNLNCSNNKLSTLNLSANTNLVNLYCIENLFTELDIKSNIALKSLWCSQNKITNLNLTNNIDLTILSCEGNQLSALDLTSNTKLEDLKCSSNLLNSSFDISNNKKLKWINLQNNPNLNIIYVWSGFDTYSQYYDKDAHANWVVK